MTLPDEALRSFKGTRKFLCDLGHKGGIKRIPVEVREIARCLLRHYPLTTMLHDVAEEAERQWRIGQEDERNTWSLYRELLKVMEKEVR